MNRTSVVNDSKLINRETLERVRAMIDATEQAMDQGTDISEFDFMFQFFESAFGFQFGDNVK